MKQNGTWYVPTISAGKFVAEKAKIDGYLPGGGPAESGADRCADPRHFGNAYKAGVPIAFGTDAGVGYHGDNATEFGFMVEAGMPVNLRIADRHLQCRPGHGL